MKKRVLLGMVVAMLMSSMFVATTSATSTWQPPSYGYTPPIVEPYFAYTGPPKHVNARYLVPPTYFFYP